MKKCSALTLYRNPCKNKDVGENSLCKKHNIIESNACPKIEGKCIYISKNNKRCNQNAYVDGEDKDYCAKHSLYVLSNKMNGNCICCINSYINIQQEKLDSLSLSDIHLSEIEIYK